MGHSMVETVSIILSAEEEGKGGRLEMPKATMPTNIEHWPGPYLLYLLTTPQNIFSALILSYCGSAFFWQSF